MYQGRTAAPTGLVFGHENMGIVTVRPFRSPSFPSPT